MDKNMKKDMEDLFKKYGLKADDVESTESKEQSKESQVVVDLAKSITEKLADMIATNKGLGDGDKKSLDSHLKTKILTSWAGLREVTYPSDLKNLSKEETIVTFFKSLIYAGSDPVSSQVLRALVEGTDAAGGYLVPSIVSTEIFQVLPDYAIMRNVARILPMTTDSLKINSLGTRPHAYWTSEYQSSSTTSAQFNEVVMTPNDLVCLLPISEQLLADANIDLVQFIIQLFAQAIGVAEDKAFFTGSGTGQPKGISQETLANKALGAATSFDDILDLIDLTPQRVVQSPNAAFVANRSVKRLLRKIKDSNNDYIWRDGKGGVGGSGESVRLPDTLYGYPFYEQNDLGQKELYFGDWSAYVIADRQTLTVQTTNVGGDAWRRNAVEIKAVTRVDGKAVMTTPFAKLTNLT